MGKGDWLWKLTQENPDKKLLLTNWSMAEVDKMLTQNEYHDAFENETDLFNYVSLMSWPLRTSFCLSILISQ